jgi:hypothetical protein
MTEFKDISTEIFREYTFPGGDKVTISKPVRLAVSDSGGHRIVDAVGASHYIPPRWIHLRFEVVSGAPNFSF